MKGLQDGKEEGGEPEQMKAGARREGGGKQKRRGWRWKRRRWEQGFKGMGARRKGNGSKREGARSQEVGGGRGWDSSWERRGQGQKRRR